MKITIDMPDDLARRVKDLARREHRTLRSLVEKGLRVILGRQGKVKRPFRLKDGTFHGDGLTAEAKAAGWATIVDWSYRERT